MFLGIDLGTSAIKLLVINEIESSGYFIDDSLEKHHAIAQMDMLSPMVLSHYFGAKMAERGRGAILFISSLSGWTPQPYMSHYGAVKAYILSLGAGLHEEMKGRGMMFKYCRLALLTLLC